MLQENATPTELLSSLEDLMKQLNIELPSKNKFEALKKFYTNNARARENLIRIAFTTGLGIGIVYLIKNIVDVKKDITEKFDQLDSLCGSNNGTAPAKNWYICDNIDLNKHIENCCGLSLTCSDQYEDFQNDLCEYYTQMSWRCIAAIVLLMIFLKYIHEYIKHLEIRNAYTTIPDSVIRKVNLTAPQITLLNEICSQLKTNAIFASTDLKNILPNEDNIESIEQDKLIEIYSMLNDFVTKIQASSHTRINHSFGNVQALILNQNDLESGPTSDVRLIK